MERNSFHYNELVNSLSQSAHGDYDKYKDITYKAAENDPDFLAHFIAWSIAKSEIRDSKVAIPILSLRKIRNNALAENSIAALMTLSPRDLVKAYRFNKKLSAGKEIIVEGKRAYLQEAIQEYLTIQEENRGWWDKTAIQHRASLKELYAVSHTRPSVFAQDILFDKKYPRGSVFAKIAKLNSVSPSEAAGIIINHNIPFQIAMGALGVKKEAFEKNPEFVLALMGGMSGQQLVNNTNFLKSLGVFNSPVLNSEYNKALERAKKDKRTSTLKAGKAIENISKNENDVDQKIAAKLSQLQEVKIEKTGGIEGDWLVMGDISGSMETAIGMSVQLSSLIAKAVKGKVYLSFFNTSPRLYDITGKSLEEIKAMTNTITAGGGTNIGVSIRHIGDRGIVVNGIAIVSDGGEHGIDSNGTSFRGAYLSYIKKMGIEPNIYFFKLTGSPDRLSNQVEMNVFDLRGKEADYYSLPNLIKTMKTKRYGLLDEILDTPLLTLKKVFAAAA